MFSGVTTHFCGNLKTSLGFDGCQENCTCLTVLCQDKWRILVARCCSLVGLSPYVCEKGALDASAYWSIGENFMLPNVRQQFGDDSLPISTLQHTSPQSRLGRNRAKTANQAFLNISDHTNCTPKHCGTCQLPEELKWMQRVGQNHNKPMHNSFIPMLNLHIPKIKPTFYR